MRRENFLAGCELIYGIQSRQIAPAQQDWPRIATKVQAMAGALSKNMMASAQGRNARMATFAIAIAVSDGRVLYNLSVLWQRGQRDPEVEFAAATIAYQWLQVEKISITYTNYLQLLSDA